MRARSVAVWALGAAYGVLWIGGIARRLTEAGTSDPPWAAPLFLILAAAIPVVTTFEWRVAALFGGGGFLSELAGVHTGVPFGLYRYTALLGPILGGVPLAIACAWIVLLLWARDLAWRITRNLGLAILLGSALMTCVDLLIDPVASRILGYWQWQQPGAYFGVPLANFAGWFAVSGLLLWLSGPPIRPSRTVAVMGASVICFFALIAVTG